MKKTKLLLLIVPLLLTGCSTSLLDNDKPHVNEGVTPNVDIIFDEPQEEVEEVVLEENADEVEEIATEEAFEEEPQVVIDEPVMDEEEPITETPVVEETSSIPYEDRPVYNEQGEYISPVYRAMGTTNLETIHLNVRSYEATITDSGRVNQKMDIVYLDYNYAGLEDLGYYWLDVKVTLTAREVNDGYQYLFLYNTTQCQSVGESFLENFVPSAGDGIKQGMLFKEQFELGAGYKQTSWEVRSFHFYVYVGNLIDNIYLRYGANGFLADTWVNKDIKVEVTPKKTKN